MCFRTILLPSIGAHIERFGINNGQHTYQNMEFVILGRVGGYRSSFWVYLKQTKNCISYKQGKE